MKQPPTANHLVEGSKVQGFTWPYQAPAVTKNIKKSVGWFVIFHLPDLFWLVQVGLWRNHIRKFAICCWWSVSCIYVALLHPRIHFTHEIRPTKNTPKVLKEYFVRLMSFSGSVGVENSRKVENHVAKMQKQTIHGFGTSIVMTWNSWWSPKVSQFLSASKCHQVSCQWLPVWTSLGVACVQAAFFGTPRWTPELFVALARNVVSFRC